MQIFLLIISHKFSQIRNIRESKKISELNLHTVSVPQGYFQCDKIAKGHRGNFLLTMRIRDYPPTK
jgi:hypothetical protein